MIKCNIQCVVYAEQIGFEECCETCPNKEGCEMICTEKSESCGNAVFEEIALATFENKSAAIIKSIADLVTQKAAVEKSVDNLKMKLEAAMLEYGIEKVDNDVLKINYIQPTTRTSIDGKKLEATYPHIYAECSKTSPVKGYIKIELKGDKKK